MTVAVHPAAPHHLPAFIAAPGETDVFMVVMAVVLVVAVLAIGLLFLRLHTLPERIAHKGHKLQFEIVAVLGLLALIDIPDFGWPLRRMAGALEKIAGLPPGEGAADVPDETGAVVPPPEDTRPPSQPTPKIIPLNKGS